MRRVGLQEGLYEELVSAPLARAIAEAEAGGLRASIEGLDPADAAEVLARHVGSQLAHLLALVPQDDQLAAQTAISNELLALAEQRVAQHLEPDRHQVPLRPELLVAVGAPRLGRAPEPPPRPASGLLNNVLLTNAPHEPRVGHEVASEIASADRIDLLCSFIKWSGYRRLREELRAHLVERCRPLRVLTTTYLGATDRRALDELVRMGAEVRVSYDTRTTRLHAKAWLFHRNTEYSTAYIGSSNLSVAALTDGLEWNVRVSAIESPAVVRKFAHTFDSYWASPDFEPYDPGQDAERFDRAVRVATHDDAEDAFALLLDVHPYPFQVEILERLDTERRVHGRTRNLVVAATGTGKTVIAALDFKRLQDELGRASLLFVAHRAEILKQSRRLFGTVLRDPQFGELLVEGERPREGRHVFASIQSLARIPTDSLPARAWDIVIVDEFHHAAAKTYADLLAHLEPKVLLGLTATPERADGRDILGWFGGRVAAELRLWEAIDRQLLCPFEYFGIDDDADFSRLLWTRGRYDAGQLRNLLTGDHGRALLVLRAVRERIAAPRAMRALGFCVGIAHARFMADEFTKAGIPSLAVIGEEPSDVRANAIRRLRERELNVLFTVDVFNEGVDVPEVDTVLLLRPTESATVFLQQLGRGLRHSRDKACLTVLDFIGNPHERFRFDLRFRALIGAPRGQLARQVQEGFPMLPSGCAVRLEPVAQQRVLANLRQALSTATRHLSDELRAHDPAASLADFLRDADLELTDVYRSGRTWRDLRAAAGRPVAALRSDDVPLLHGVQDLVEFDDPVCLDQWLDALRSPEPPRRFDPDELSRRRWQMLAVAFDEAAPHDLRGFLTNLWSPAVREELIALFEVLRDRVAHLASPFEVQTDRAVPLHLHCRYSLVQVLAAFDDVTPEGRVRRPQQGVYLQKSSRCDLLFVTLRKSEREYSPTTMYRDYAISPHEFHWESQNNAVPERGPGLRHVDPAGSGVTPVLLVRETKKDERGRTAAYQLLGPVEPMRWSGERPIQIVWRLRHPMPAEMFVEARVAV